MLVANCPEIRTNEREKGIRSMQRVVVTLHRRPIGMVGGPPARSDVRDDQSIVHELQIQGARARLVPYARIARVCDWGVEPAVRPAFHQVEEVELQNRKRFVELDGE